MCISDKIRELTKELVKVELPLIPNPIKSKIKTTTYDIRCLNEFLANEHYLRTRPTKRNPSFP